MKHILTSLILFLTIFSLSAKIELPEIIGDNMVLQQNMQVNLWGWAAPNGKISVVPSWNGKKYFAAADSLGKWKIKIETPAASYVNYTISISDGKDKTVISNVLIGEVWFASGQSNMEMPLNGFWGCPIKDANITIANAADYKKSVRFATVPKTAALTPQEKVSGKWQECTPQNAAWFSATAYHFATQLAHTLDVPVGIIVCSWGGTRVESWTNRELNELYGENLTDAVLLNNSGEDYLRPLVMFNAMLNPLTNYTISGYIWYQGCSNVGHHDVYAQRLKNMVELWRTLWNQGDLPFYYVEIAPYIYGDSIAAAYLREAQCFAQKIIPNSAMISTNDLVEPFEFTNVHPQNKTAVGQRLAFLALNKTYGFKSIECYSPQYKSVTFKNNVAVLTFDYANDAFNRDFGFVGFEMAGENKIFYPANGIVKYGSEKTIELTCEQVSNPVAVRYCFKNTQVGNVTSTRGLPLVPFRTDNWE